MSLKSPLRGRDRYLYAVLATTVVSIAILGCTESGRIFLAGLAHRAFRSEEGTLLALFAVGVWIHSQLQARDRTLAMILAPLVLSIGGAEIVFLFGLHGLSHLLLPGILFIATVCSLITALRELAISAQEARQALAFLALALGILFLPIYLSTVSYAGEEESVATGPRTEFPRAALKAPRTEIDSKNEVESTKKR